MAWSIFPKHFRFILSAAQDRECRQFLWREKNKSFKEMRNTYSTIVFLLLAIFTFSVVNQKIDKANLPFPQLKPSTINGNYLSAMTEYITRLFCANESYRFNHIYLERSLSTELADNVIYEINNCATAGSMISR